MKSKIICPQCAAHTDAREPYFCESCKKPVVGNASVLWFSLLADYLEANGRDGARKRLLKELEIEYSLMNAGLYSDFVVNALTPEERSRIVFEDEEDEREHEAFEKDLEMIRSHFGLSGHILLALR